MRLHEILHATVLQWTLSTVFGVIFTNKNYNLLKHFGKFCHGNHCLVLDKPRKAFHHHAMIMERMMPYSLKYGKLSTVSIADWESCLSNCRKFLPRSFASSRQQNLFSWLVTRWAEKKQLKTFSKTVSLNNYQQRLKTCQTPQWSKYKRLFL